MGAETWQTSLEHERLFMNLNAILMKLGWQTCIMLRYMIHVINYSNVFTNVEILINQLGQRIVGLSRYCAEIGS